VAVLDVTMPVLNGIAATREIRRLSPETRVLGLSMHAERALVADLFAAGGSGYVIKSAPLHEVLVAVRKVAAGGVYVCPQIASIVPDMLPGDDRSRRRGAGGLSQREAEVLQLVAEGKSSKEIAADLHVATKTVDWHRQSIMDKLAIRSVAELTKYAIRAGLTPLGR
jgi:DNA-binding NarL/FixJ family response regulator